MTATREPAHRWWRTRPTHPPARTARTRIAAGMAVAALTVLTACGSAPTDAPAPPVGSPVSAQGELTASDVEAWLDGSLPGAMDRAGIAGGAAVVVKDGEVLSARGYGNADTGTDDDGEAQPVDPDGTLFRIGSVSKLFTATAVMQLVEDGEVDLDTDVNEYLDFTLPLEFDTAVTLRHLLTHTPGFEERLDGLISVDGQAQELRDVVVEEPPEQVYEPGSVPAYSNYGNGLAGYIVQNVSGTPFEKYIDKNILQPTGMSSSSFQQPLPDELAGAMSQGYNTDVEPAQPFEMIAPAPAGSMSATPQDMSLFMLDQLGELDEEQRTLEPETRQLMQEPALDSDSLGTLANGPRMTLGYFDESRNGHRVIGHGGDTNFFHSHMQLFPEASTGIFVTLNSNGHNGYENHEIRQSILADFADRYFPLGEDESTDQEAVPQATAKEHAALAEGSYDSARSMHSTFLNAANLDNRTQVTARDDGTIVIEPGPAAVHPAVYEEVEPWVWREVGGQRTVTMRVEDGEVEAIGFESAFALLPVKAGQDTTLMLTVLVTSSLIMLAGLVAPLVAAVTRRVRKLPARDPSGRLARILTRVALGSGLLATGGWLMVIGSIMEMQDVPSGVVRGVQALQLIGQLGLVPAVFVLVHAVKRRSFWSVAAASTVVLALLGFGWFGNTFMFLAPSVSY